MGPAGVLRFIATALFEFLRHIPACLALRRAYAGARNGRTGDPVVAWVSDNFDEVNGIALSSRIMLRELRALGKPVFMYGAAFHSKPPRVEGPDGAVIIAPGRFSLDQAGYDKSEVAIPDLGHFLDFLRRQHVDILEFETPGTVPSLCLWTAMIIGIPTLSHYRTDIPTYARLLVKNAAGAWFIIQWVKAFTRLAGPVIVPSRAYRAKVRGLGVPDGRIHHLPRGVDLRSFHPDHARDGAWSRLGLPAEGVRLLYVGRVSREKNLELLADAYVRMRAERPDLSLTVVGDGPYLEALKARLAGVPGARFTGVLHGPDLAGVFASADLFVFPSLTDTFGNSVVEALASGLPCVVSDQGGPCEIVVDGECGRVFRHDVPGDLEDKVLALARDPGRLRAMRAAARERALHYSYDGAAKAFWDYYLRFHHTHRKD
jgi:glycosyltransferase involved in cell wall biosynthesis